MRSRPSQPVTSLRRLSALAVVAALLAFGLTPATAHHAECAGPNTSGGEWRQFNGDLAGTRNQAKEFHLDQLSVPTLEPAWTFDANRNSVHDGERATNSEITGYPVVADGCVYVGTSTGNQ